MAASKSSYLQLFDAESKHDDYSFLVSNKQAHVKFEDAYPDAVGRPMEFKASGQGQYNFYSNGSSYELSARLSGIESDVATNAANPVPANNTQAIADVTVAYQAKDAQIEASVTAEISRASTAEASLQSNIDAVDSGYKAADVVLQNAISAEASSRAAALSAEETRALAAEASLQQQISSILSNADPSLIDSLSELLSHVNAADQNLINQIATLQSELDDLKARFDQLTSE